MNKRITKKETKTGQHDHSSTYTYLDKARS